MSRASAAPCAARVSARRVATAMLVSEADLHDHAGLMSSYHSFTLCSQCPGPTRYNICTMQLYTARHAETVHGNTVL